MLAGALAFSNLASDLTDLLVKEGANVRDYNRSVKPTTGARKASVASTASSSYSEKSITQPKKKKWRIKGLTKPW